MSALSVGQTAPEFTLPVFSGGVFSLKEALESGPVVLFFFKISCPVCQYAAPFMERLHEMYPGISIIGVSQNDAEQTAQFMRQFGITFPVAIDDVRKYPVSNAYGLTNVPTSFYVEQNQEIRRSVVGWSRGEMELIARDTALTLNAIPAKLFKPGEDVADFRAG